MLGAALQMKMVDVEPPAGWAVRRPGGGGSFKFDGGDPLYALARRVPVREGDLMVWDQRCVHGSAPNHSTRPRLAMFLRCCRREGVPVANRKDRAMAVARAMVDGGCDLTKHVDSIGRELFGLEDAFTEIQTELS